MAQVFNIAKLLRILGRENKHIAIVDYHSERLARILCEPLLQQFMCMLRVVLLDALITVLEGTFAIDGGKSAWTELAECEDYRGDY